MDPIHRKLAAAVGGLIIAGSAAAQTSVGVGFEYTTGNYGATESTETIYVPFVLKHETGPWILKATLPYLRLSGPGNVVGGGPDRIVVPGLESERRTVSGLGDIVASAFYNLMDERKGGLGVDLGFKIKLPTADEQDGLGTGETDYAFQLDFFRPFPQKLCILGHIADLIDFHPAFDAPVERVPLVEGEVVSCVSAEENHDVRHGGAHGALIGLHLIRLLCCFAHVGNQFGWECFGGRNIVD